MYGIMLIVEQRESLLVVLNVWYMYVPFNMILLSTIIASAFATIPADLCIILLFVSFT